MDGQAEEDQTGQSQGQTDPVEPCGTAAGRGAAAASVERIRRAVSQGSLVREWGYAAP